MSLLPSSIQQRICPGLWLVGAPCRTMVLACTGGPCGPGVRWEVRVDGAGVVFGGVGRGAGFFPLLLGGCACCAVLPVALPFPLVSFGCRGVVVFAGGGGVACVAASAYEWVGGGRGGIVEVAASTYEGPGGVCVAASTVAGSIAAAWSSAINQQLSQSCGDIKWS